jgi:hypothetical protein
MNELLQLPEGLVRPSDVSEKDWAEGLKALADVRARVLERGMAIFEGQETPVVPVPPEQPTRIHPTYVGASSELLVCADLLLKGFEVFRSVSTNCSCDIVALKNGKLLRVESKTVADKGKIPSADKAKFDILAVVTDGGVTYHPALS